VSPPGSLRATSRSVCVIASGVRSSWERWPRISCCRRRVRRAARSMVSKMSASSRNSSDGLSNSIRWESDPGRRQACRVGDAVQGPSNVGPGRETNPPRRPKTIRTSPASFADQLRHQCSGGSTQHARRKAEISRTNSLPPSLRNTARDHADTSRCRTQGSGRRQTPRLPRTVYQHDQHPRRLTSPEALLLLSSATNGPLPRAPRSVPSIAEEAAETLLPLQRGHGITIELRRPGRPRSAHTRCAAV